ncbi:MAG TPA: serine/threonine-protein kinase, partial [Kofleriaceae bacterium]|nr:serine/threonine-protein kinase [Kofleriaceae bacterium]
FTRDVAIKRVLPGFSDVLQFSEMFIQEARIASKLLHNAIVQVFDFDRDAEGRLFLVMEFVEGKDLNSVRDSCLLPPAVIIYVMIEVLRALEYAHDLPVPTAAMRGVIHRDVSPHNVLLSWDGGVKLSDFGIAKARQATAATASDQIKGKIAYMSPEQANGNDLDGRSDLWACGVMLFELLTGRPLFVGTTQEALAQVFHLSIPSPSTLRADVPPDLEAITMRLLQRDLSARYAKASEVIRDLMACRDMTPNGRDQLVLLLAAQFPAALAARSSPDSNGAPSAPLMTSHPHDAIVTASARPHHSGTPVMSKPATPTTPTTLGGAVGQSVTAGSSRSRRWIALGVVTGGVGLGAIVAFAVTRTTNENPSPPVVSTNKTPPGTSMHSPAIIVDAALAIAPIVAPTSIHVTVETKPPKAIVIVDHERLGPSPVTITTSVGAHHDVLATLDGYADDNTSLTVDRDAQTFVLVLSAKPEQRATARPSSPPRPPSSPTSPPPKRFDPNGVGGDD